MSLRPPLPRMEFVDDGMYNNQWNIYDDRGNIYAQAFTERAAQEIFFAVNYLRGQEAGEHALQTRKD